MMIHRLLLTLLVLFVSLPTLAEEEPLKPEVAFKVSATLKDANTINVTWIVADRYYLYHNKFNFRSDTPGITLGTARIPAGKKKQDPNVGLVETHRKQVTIELPFKRSDKSIKSVKLTLGAQGCADLGICYPPYQKAVSVNLAAAKPVKSLPALGRSLGLEDNSQEFLPPEKAFALRTQVLGDGTVVARWQIARGYYLYRSKFKFLLKNAPDPVKIGKILFPKGQIKQDPNFGRMEVYHNQVEVRIPVTGIQAGQKVKLEISYQGCAEAGLCYPPAFKTVSLSSGSAGTAVKTSPTQTAGTGKTTTTKSVDRKEQITKKLSGLEYFLTILQAFGIGLLLTFTPCVLPMIPIMSSIIIGQSGKGEISKTKGASLAFTYVMGTAVIYTIAGYWAGSTGDQLQSYLQNPWGIGILSGILALLALSMFGLYNIQMPSFMQSRLQEGSSKLKGGSYIGVFAMGILASMIVGACVSPLLIGQLIVAINLQDPVLGALIMLAMALGMGVILIAIGAGFGALVPRAGTWMDTVKYFFGVLLLAVAIYMLQALPEVPVLYLWAALFIITGVYMGATQSLPEGSSGWKYLWKGIGTVLIIWGVFALIGAFANKRDIMHPIDLTPKTIAVSSTAQGTGKDAEHLFTRITTTAELEKLLHKARQSGKAVMVDYFATWCTDCRRMEVSTFLDPRVKKLLDERFIAVQADVTKTNDTSRALKRRFGVFGPPAIVILKPNGTQVRGVQVHGYKSADALLDYLQRAFK